MGGKASDLSASADARDDTRARDGPDISARAQLSAHAHDTSHDLEATENSDDWGIIKQLGDWGLVSDRFEIED